MAIAIYEIKIPSSDTFRIFVDFPDEFTSIGLQKATDAIEEEIKEYYSDNAVINKYVQDFVVLYGGAVDTKLKEKIQSLIDEIACDFYKHEPFIDPIARKHVHETLDKLDKAVRELADTVQEQRKQPEKPIPEPLPLGEPPVITTAGQIFDELAKIEDEEAAERMRLAYLERRKQELIEQRNQMKNIQKELQKLTDDLVNAMTDLQKYIEE